MNKKMIRNLMIIITYTAVLILFVINFKPVMQGLWKFVVLFKPLFVGMAIAFILNKPYVSIDRLLGGKILRGKKRGLARGLSVAATYLLALLLITLIINFVIPQLKDSLHLFLNNIGSYVNNLQDLINNAAAFLDIESIDLSSLNTKLLEYITKLGSSLTGLLSQIISITTGVISIIATMVISLIFSIYLLAGKEKLLSQTQKVLHTYLPQKIYKTGSYVYHVTTDTFNKFVVGQLTEAFILGTICFIGMLIFRFEYPLLISVLIAITALVPVVGAYIGGMISFALLLMISPIKAIWFLVFLLVLQQFEGNVIYPRVVGGSLGLPGIWVLLSIIVGGGLAGPIGILLGVPVATVLYTLLKNDIHGRTDEEV